MNKPVTIRPAFETPADPAVEDILRDSERKQAEAGLSQEERRLLIERRRREEQRKEKALQKSHEQLPNRINLLLPCDLKARLMTIARWNSVTISQVVTFLLYEAVEQVDRGNIRLGDHRVPCDSPRYDYTLIHPKDSERQAKQQSTEKQKNSWGGGK